MLADKLPASGLPAPYQHAIWLMLATGCRVDEISKAEWAHVNFKSRRLVIPAEHAKNGKKHEIHLSDLALRHLRALEVERNTAWLFPNRTGDGPIHRQTISKQIADRQRVKKIRGRAKHSDSLILAGPRWTPHDLRRTAATIMQEQGIMPHIIKKCMNQRFEDRMMETYQRAELAAMQQTAFDRLGDTLDLLHKPQIRSAA